MNDAKRTAKGHFKKGTSGNPAGRPIGSRNKATLAREQLLDGKSEQLTAKLVEMALEGNIHAMRMCMDRTVPPRKQRCINLDLRPITDPQDRIRQFEDLTLAVADGRITPSEGESVSNILISQAKILQLVELARRLPKIEDKKKYLFDGSMEELLQHYHHLVNGHPYPNAPEETAHQSGKPKEFHDA